MRNREAVVTLEDEMGNLFSNLAELQHTIKSKLLSDADGKNLKGNELVGWLGEIYGKLLFGGHLVDDRKEHDFETSEGWRISVKTRKGHGSGWRQSSAIPKIEGDDCPTHLLFVHLNDDYSIDRMWLYEWNQLKEKGRFRPHIVRGRQRSFIFKLNEKDDHSFIVYHSTANE